MIQRENRAREIERKREIAHTNQSKKKIIMKKKNNNYEATYAHGSHHITCTIWHVGWVDS